MKKYLLIIEIHFFFSKIKKILIQIELSIFLHFIKMLIKQIFLNFKNKKINRDVENFGYTCFLETDKVLSLMDPTDIHTLRSTNFKFQTPPDFYKNIPYIQSPIIFSKSKNLIRFRHDIIDRRDLNPL